MAVDNLGDVFVAALGNSTITEILPNNTTRPIGSGFSHPSGVAVDAAGDVYVADTGHNAVKEVLPDGTILIIGSGFSQPSGVAVDGTATSLSPTLATTQSKTSSPTALSGPLALGLASRPA